MFIITTKYYIYTSTGTHLNTSVRTEIEIKLIRMSYTHVHSGTCRDIPTPTNLDKEEKHIQSKYMYKQVASLRVDLFPY